jgi:hypothetical protein
MAASDKPSEVLVGPAGLARQARLLADLDLPDGLPALTEVRRSDMAVTGAVPTAGQCAHAEPGLPDAVSTPAAPASRLLAETPGSPSISAQTAVTAPPGPGAPPPAFAAVAGAVAPHTATALAAPALRQATGARAVNRAEVLSNLGRTGLSFERNMGQTASRVDYLAHTGNGTVFLTPTAAVFAMQEQSAVSSQQSAGLPSTPPGVRSTNAGVALYMDIVGANPAGRAAGVNPLPGKVNSFLGNDPAKWHSNIPTFGRVEYANVYSGISLAYYGGPGGLEYDFVLAPGADPHAIALKFEGASGVELDAQGDLVVHTAAGDLVQHAPVVYQDSSGARQPVAGRFALHSELKTQNSKLKTFDVGPYDHSRPLVIDPLVLGYSTYLGGAKADLAYGIAVDGKAGAYVAGQTLSSNFPTTPGAFDTSYNGGGAYYGDAFVAKLAADGTGLVYGTYLGSSGSDGAEGIAVDGSGYAYVTGFAGEDGTGFPTTVQFGREPYGAFITKLNPTGSGLVYSAVVSEVYGTGIAVDAAGEAMITGTAGPGFPVTPGAFQTTFGGGSEDVYALKLNGSGTALVYATYLGGVDRDGGSGIASDGAGHAFITGYTWSPNFPTTPGSFQPLWQHAEDAFIVKLSPDGTALDYGAFLGGYLNDFGSAVAVDAAGDAYLTGRDGAHGFPVTGGGGPYDTGAFLAKVNPAGSALVYCWLFTGVEGQGIAVDAAGSPYVTGYIESGTLVTTPDGFDTTYNGGGKYHADATLSGLNPDGNTLVYGTYLGGSNDDFGDAVAVDPGGNVYVTGYTQSSDFPTTPDALKRRNRDGQYDGFVTKFALVS